jgi:hypothetical protein
MKTDVRALEYAVSALVFRLDLLMTAMFGIRPLATGDGFHISTPEYLRLSGDAFVTIRPFGWPKESSIHARFLKRSSGWELHEGGEIHAAHLGPFFTGRVRFSAVEGGLGIHIHPQGDQFEVVTSSLNRLSRWIDHELDLYTKAQTPS